MRNKFIIIVCILILPILGFAQSVLSLSFFPGSVEVNRMNTSSFDPFVPDSQPILTTLKIANNGTPVRIDLKVGVYWNGHFLVDSTFESINDLVGSIYLSNRDLITNQNSTYFQTKGDANISIDAIVKANSLLKSAVYAGYFPDGDLQIRVWVRPYAPEAWIQDAYCPGYQEFAIRIRSAGSINLISPGVEVGQTPPQLDSAPILFLWNSLATGINDYRLVIREYAPNYPPDINSVANTGNVFYETPQGLSEQSGFSSYLPFANGNYYAWKVQTALSNEYNNDSGSSSSTQSSDWYVFKYVTQTDNASSINEFQARLNMLNNPFLLKLYMQGYQPVGVIVYEDRTYSGQDAFDLIESLLGQDILVEMKD